jgi:hypothetical protein
MNINSILDTMGQQATQWLQQAFPNMPQQVLHFGGGAVLGALALILFLTGIRLLRKPKTRNTSSTRTDIPRSLQSRGMSVDLLTGPENDRLVARFVITNVKPGRIKCEIIERLDVIRTDKGKDVACVFAPLKTRDGKINTFTATMVETDRNGRNPDRIILSTPVDYALITRRKHIRKRVADQQFIRVKLWIANPSSNDISFEDAAPQIGVNAFTLDGPDQGANGVINISGGGIGLSVLNRLLPETCAPGEQVVLNLFMFNFKEKTFKPYWYAGVIRSTEEGRPGFTRMGIEFTDVGQADRTSGRLSWIEL